MANRFVRSAAAGTGSGADWTNAHTTLAAAITASTAGDTFFVADDHAETGTAALTLTFKGGALTRDTILCADHTVASPTAADLKTTGSVTTTGTAAAITINGYFYMYGVKFNVGTSTSAQKLNQATGALAYQTYDSCRFAIPSTGAANISIGSTGGKVVWTNCVISFGSASTNVNPAGGAFEWYNTASAIDTGATLPTSLFVPSGTVVTIRCEGVDLSALGSGKNLFNLANGNAVQALLKDCKLGTSINAITSNNWLGWRLDMIRCDSGNTNYRNETHLWMGDQTTETTIVRTGGATDGTTGFSHKVVSGSTCLWSSPFDMLPIAIWNDTTGSAKTITVEGIASAVPNNDEVWMEVEYLGDSTSPQGSRASTRKATVLTTAAANTTSSSTWGGALTGKFKMAVTITPQQKGPITVYVKVGKASATVYIDPMITVT
jgi:hypothetical protein